MKKEILLPTSLVEGVGEAGCDEVGRGCLAGPVVAAAVVLPDGFMHPLLRDSKTLSERRRCEAREIIIENAVDWCVAEVSAVEIDRMNILRASIMAMHRALDGLKKAPGHIGVDGNRFEAWRDVKYTTVVKGDGKLANIAAAAILAKVHRDELMSSLHKAMPVYGWDCNKGYPTRFHRQSIKDYGVSGWHRMSFSLLK